MKAPSRFALTGYSGGLRQAFIVDKHYNCHKMFIVYFADKKFTTGFCFVPCYCIVVDDVNQQFGFHGNAPPLVNNAH